MAGIGFELKKLFSKQGVIAGLRAYGYAAVVCTGPMLLSVALLLGVRYVAERNGANGFEQELLNSIITYTLLASLTVSSILSIITTRYTADMLFIEKKELVMPSMYGNISISLFIGVICYGVFLINSGIEMIHQIFALILFSELVVVWIQINYITALKDYKSILLAFTGSIVSSLISGLLLGFTGIDTISSIIISVTIGYGVMMSWFFVLLHRYFPKGEGSAFQFLSWIDKYPQLLWIGLLTTIGLFGHLVIMWASPIGVQIKGLFYGAPSYDVPALFAFFSILVTTINFVTSVEVNFYPRYRQYFGLFNDGGTLSDIKRAEEEMLIVLRQELFYLALRQVFATVLFIAVGGALLVRLNIGFSDTMLGTFRILCVGYALYAIANSLMLIQLYFVDNIGAFFTSLLFSVFANVGTFLFMKGYYWLYGFGFIAGCFAMYVVSWLRLTMYLRKLDYHVLCSQPVLYRMHKGHFTRIALYLQERAERSDNILRARERGEELQ